jgi:hypothetical protein
MKDEGPCCPYVEYEVKIKSDIYMLFHQRCSSLVSLQRTIAVCCNGLWTYCVPFITSPLLVAWFSEEYAHFDLGAIPVKKDFFLSV